MDGAPLGPTEAAIPRAWQARAVVQQPASHVRARGRRAAFRQTLPPVFPRCAGSRVGVRLGAMESSERLAPWLRARMVLRVSRSCWVSPMKVEWWARGPERPQREFGCQPWAGPHLRGSAARPAAPEDVCRDFEPCWEGLAMDSRRTQALPATRPGLCAPAARPCPVDPGPGY
jgi:hypothetical protein